MPLQYAFPCFWTPEISAEDFEDGRVAAISFASTTVYSIREQEWAAGAPDDEPRKDVCVFESSK